MTITKNSNTESSPGDGGSAPPPPEQPENPHSRGGNTVFKSGPLFISSKGIGWTSWKKRWFILTRNSLVFFRSDPSSIPQKGISEVNLTLGGIDLNNSGSVVVKADKKLLTVLFPDGRDGRTFTLKAENSEDLHEWKTALENALAQAPSAALVMGQNGIFRNDQTDGTDVPLEQLKGKQPAKSLVLGRPILLALEDVDGSPSFLEKALRFIEKHGIKVEGILRQAADVDDVEHRVWEYEQGKMEFSSEEDAHVIADCVKYFLRELPSSPVPASCCNALLEACRTDRAGRVNAMRAAICETFPEPNRCLLQRILLMMQNVASHKAVNRMSTSAVAACMAPLLLRPLLSGDCEIESDFNVGGDGSIQLLRAAAAANHAQAIVITLLEEYDNIFSEGSVTPGLYSDSEEGESEEEEVTDDDDDSYEDDEHDDATQESDAYTDDDLDNALNGTCTSNGDSSEDNLFDNKEKKILSMESNDHSFEDEVEIQKLEASKIKLQNRISEEAKSNAILQAILEQRKKALYEHRRALEKDVAKLQEQLQKERDKRTVLESALNKSQDPLPDTLVVDEKVKAEVEEISHSEAEVTNLKQKVDDLNVQLNQQGDQIYGSTHDSSNILMNTSNHQTNWKDKHNDTEAAASCNFPRRSARKDTCMDKTEYENEEKHESASLLNKNLPQNQQSDPRRSGNSRSNASINSKRSSTRSEGLNSTTSALTKLTTRLNFLKERRSQIANELQNIDKVRGSNQTATVPDKGSGSELNQSLQNLDKSQGSEVHSNPEKGKGSEGSQSSQDPEKGIATECQFPPNSKESTKPDGTNQAGGK